MDVSVRDLKMMYQSSVILWKGTPCYVTEITGDYYVRLFDLGKQRFKTVKWIPENFAPPSVRIGYINLGTNCIYVHRIPVRRYKIGLSPDNVVQIPVDHKLSAEEKDEAYQTVSRLRSVALFDALSGNYPTVAEAFQDALENKGVVAFDKQFAVSHNTLVYYKGKHVGTFCEGNVVFNDEHKHLTKAFLSR